MYRGSHNKNALLVQYCNRTTTLHYNDFFSEKQLIFKLSCLETDFV